MSWTNAMSDFQMNASEWNRNCYGNLFHMKRCLMARSEALLEIIDLTSIG